ncbi:MAG: hypothetical protein IJJ80_01290 [Clostridia bacterium]|nr:hypothetical protein [Clostridia bacterium]
MTNQEIKLKAAGAGVRLWEIAEKLGITDGNFSRKLRRELPEDEKNRILDIIKEIGERRVSR